MGSFERLKAVEKAPITAKLRKLLMIRAEIRRRNRAVPERSAAEHWAVAASGAVFDFHRN
jgi:hypothetical protein